MGTALTWLNDLIQWFGRWIPRLTLVQPTHRGVLFGPGGSARAVGPGLVMYWPMTHVLVEMPVTTQSVQLCAQLLPDGGVNAFVPHVRICAVAVQFRAHDPVVAATRSLHVHALVDNRAQASIAKHVDPSTTVWRERAVAALREELVPYGVTLERLDFTQHGTGVAIKSMTDWSYSDSASGTRPTP